MPVQSTRSRLAALALLLAPGCGTVTADPDNLPNGGAEPLPPSGVVAGTLSPAAGETVTFGLLGDFGSSGAALSSVARMIRSWSPDFIVTTGDNNYGNLDVNYDYDQNAPGMQNSWEINVGAYFGDYILGRNDGKYGRQTSTTQRFWPVVGNHDSLLSSGHSTDEANAAGPIADYVDYFHNNPGGTPRLPMDRGAVHTAAKSYYALRRGPVDFFFLDADLGYQWPPDPEGLDEQKAWLLARLAESTARWKVAVFHQPPITSSFRTGAAWMDWSELLGCDLVLCGHDHFYERLLFRTAVPMVISGAGGASLYGFATSPHEASQFRFNTRHSALWVRADGQSIRVECRTPPLAAGQTEETIEAWSLGQPTLSGDDEDTYSFYAEAGEIVTALTRTPGAGNLLNPRLQLIHPDGSVVRDERDNAPDGKNAQISYSIPLAGTWRLTLRPESAAAGTYELQAGLYRPGQYFSQWAAALPEGQRSATDNPDQDEWPNLTEFAAGADPLVAGLSPAALPLIQAGYDAPARSLEVTVRIPSPLRPGVTPVVEEASSPAGPWTVLAWRPPFSNWTTTRPGATVFTAVSGATRIVETHLPVSGVPRKFVRLSFTLDP